MRKMVDCGGSWAFFDIHAGREIFGWSGWREWIGLNEGRDIIKTWFNPRRHFFLHALSFEWTTKLCIKYINQFSFYFHT